MEPFAIITQDLPDGSPVSMCIAHMTLFRWMLSFGPRVNPLRDESEQSLSWQYGRNPESGHCMFFRLLTA